MVLQKSESDYENETLSLNTIKKDQKATKWQSRMPWMTLRYLESDEMEHSGLFRSATVSSTKVINGRRCITSMRINRKCAR